MSICVKAVQNFLSLPVIKQTALGVTSGLIQAYTWDHVISPHCRGTSSTLSDYYCLRTAKFFDPSRLASFFAPLVNLKESMTSFVENYIPALIPMNHASEGQCEGLIYSLIYLGRIKKFISSETYLSATEEHKNLYIECCFDRPNSSNVIASAFVEELICRLMIQKIALVAISKLFSGSTRAFLSHTATRIIIASTIFALAHDRPQILAQFIGGLTYGFLFENFRYGLLISTVSHTMGNIYIESTINDSCIKGLHTVITLAFDLFEKTKHLVFSEKAS